MAAGCTSRRGAAWAAVLFAVGAALGPQEAPAQGRLLVVGRRGETRESLLVAVDAGTGRVTTLFEGAWGELTAITMDRDNVGVTVAYARGREYGLHRLSRIAGGGLSVVATYRGLGLTSRPRSVLLSHEDTWLLGTDPEQGYGRLKRVDENAGTSVDLENFPGSVVGAVVEGRRSRWVVAAATVSAGGLWVYDSAQGVKSTLLVGLPPLVGLAAAPYDAGYLVATGDTQVPLLWVNPTGTGITTFRLPAAEPLEGIAVQRLPGGDAHPLWLLGRRHLYRLTWRSDTRTVSTVGAAAFPLPFQQAHGLVVEGSNDRLLRVVRVKDGSVDLRVRLGPGGAGKSYLFAASFGWNPPVSVDGRRWVNLTPDPLLLATLVNAAPQIFVAFQGTTDPLGGATGRIRVPAQWRSFLGRTTIFVAGLVMDPALPANLRTVTNTVGLTLF